MKCDEVKPTCGNCSKSRRDCDWLDGERILLRSKQTADDAKVTFRHQQNPALNAANSSLGKFYRGSGTFTQEQRDNFVQVKDDCECMSRDSKTILIIIMQYNSLLP